MINFWVLLEGVGSLYLLFLVITGKGKLFTHPYTQKGKEEQYKKTGRIGLGVIATMLMGLAIVNFLAGRYEEGDAAIAVLSGFNFGLAIAVLTALLILYFLLNRLHDKEKKKMPQRSVAPRAAFYFDEEEADMGRQAPKGGKKK